MLLTLKSTWNLKKEKKEIVIVAIHLMLAKQPLHPLYWYAECVCEWLKDKSRREGTGKHSPFQVSCMSCCSPDSAFQTGGSFLTIMYQHGAGRKTDTTYGFLITLSTASCRAPSLALNAATSCPSRSSVCVCWTLLSLQGQFPADYLPHRRRALYWWKPI